MEFVKDLENNSKDIILNFKRSGKYEECLRCSSLLGSPSCNKKEGDVKEGDGTKEGNIKEVLFEMSKIMMTIESNRKVIIERNKLISKLQEEKSDIECILQQISQEIKDVSKIQDMILCF